MWVNLVKKCRNISIVDILITNMYDAYNIIYFELLYLKKKFLAVKK